MIRRQNDHRPFPPVWFSSSFHHARVKKRIFSLYREDGYPSKSIWKVEKFFFISQAKRIFEKSAMPSLQLFLREKLKFPSFEMNETFHHDLDY